MGNTKKLAGALFRYISLTVFGLFILPVLYILEPFLRVRIGLMHTQRIGHLAANTEMFFRKLQINGKPPRTVYYLFGWDPANRQLFDMFLRLRLKGANFRESQWGTRFVSSWLPLLKKTRFWFPNRITAAEFHEYAHSKSVVRFTDDEDRKGLDGLAEMGIGPDDWFVCFHARDASYLRSWRPQHTEYWQKIGIDRQNCSIESYLKAADEITSRGGFAIRMGAVVEAPLPDTGNPRIIDYATKHRSDFMDIYLCSRCRFYLGSPSGIIRVPILFDRPVALANHLVFNHVPPHPNDLMIPRFLTTPDGERTVSFQEAQDQGFHMWSKRGQVTFGGQNMDLFEWRENDPDDILGVCQDMLDNLDGIEPPAEAKRLQTEYGRRYLNHMPGYELGGNVGARFALKHKHLIVPDEVSDIAV